MADKNTKKDMVKTKETVKIKTPKELLIESGKKLVNKIPDIAPLLVTVVLTEVIKFKVRKVLYK